MTYRPPSRLKRFSPSLIMVAAALFFTACATAPARPPAPISTGQERTQPGTVPVETAENTTPQSGGDLQGLPDLEEGDEVGPGEIEFAGQGFTPPHMVGRDIKRAAVLLPFSHPNARVRADAESLLAGIEFAMFNRGEDTFLILPKDTAGTQSTAQAKTAEAIAEGADIIIGPLFSANVQVARTEAIEAGVPVIGFSARPEAAGGGSYSIALSPEAEVARVVETAARRGARSFAFLGPRDGYGRRTEEALRRAVALNGGVVITSAFYAPSNDAPVDEAKQVASAINALGEREEGEIAVLIPEQGVKLRGVAPLLPYYEVDVRRVQILGTGRWNDASVWREPTLIGGIFAAPDPENMTRFEESFERIYRSKPSRLASVGYDAGAMAAALASVTDGLSFQGITNRDGFQGVNGLFRFRADGTVERSLSVLEIDATDGAIPVELGADTFDPTVG